MVLIGWITRNGSGMSGDSVWYQMGAENILAGKGYLRFSGAGELRPITHFPPFYSIVLAGLGVTGLDLASAGRWLNVALFGFNIALLWIIVEGVSRSWFLASIATTLTVVNLGTIKYYSWLMTEPLFITLMLVSLYFLLRYSQGNRLRNLITAAIFAGLAAATRLIGLGFVAAGCAFLLIINLGKVRQRLARSLLFFALAVIPAVLWLLQSSSVGEGTFNRSIIFHPMSVELLKGYFLFLGDWIQLHRLMPGDFRFVIAVLLATVGPILYFIEWIREWRAHNSPSFRLQESAYFLFLFYLVCYIVVLYVNSTLIDASTTPYAPERYLTSIYPVFVMLTLLAYFNLWKRANRKRSASVVLLLLVAGVVFLQGRVTWRAVAQDEIPLGYTDFISGHPAFIKAVQDSAQSHVIYSNNPELTYALSGIGSYILPFKYNSGTGLVNPGFGQDVEKMKEDLALGGRIIHFGEMDEQEADLYNILDLQIVSSFSAGEIYKVR
jgi:4-amino-4-deoxy-L-arabinose transferase-like glycosyltransferase